jgi:hypothetical protein
MIINHVVDVRNLKTVEGGVETSEVGDERGA